jgi:cyclophilin family peptidyl-prolyl cis-trans isomerase
VKARASYFGEFLRIPMHDQAVRNFIESHDILVRSLALEAMGVAPNDTLYFTNVLASMPRVPAEQQVSTLIALDSMWQRAKKDTAFRNPLERSHVANVYRTTLIRVTGVVMDPAVAALALQAMQDTTIINDTAFRGEASRYLYTYVKGFQARQFRDLLLPSVSAEAWLADKSPAMIAALKLAYDSARTWHDVELMDSIKSALKAVGQSTDKLLPPAPYVSNIDWDFLEKLPAKMLIGLEHGSMTLRLRTFEAPLTVLNMAKLAEKGYFSSQKFHRVVPNFVVQSGDPTGTGFGGPEYSIRTEIAPIEYESDGVVGMASSGKDTEGSQWFATICPTPHLDSHYTIWANVIAGMEDVVKIQQGDRVQSMFPMP